MASCKNCGTNVGCGCNLQNGLCSYCRKSNNITTDKNVTTKNVLNPQSIETNFPKN